MAIQQRRGQEADLDITKILPGEIVVPTTGEPAACRKAGDVVRLLTDKDVTDLQVLLSQLNALKVGIDELLVDKVGINDSTATTTQAYSGSKTQIIVDAINTLIGSTDISQISGTLSGAVSKINQDNVQNANNAKWLEWVTVNQTLASGDVQPFVRYSRNAYETEIAFINPITNLTLQTWAGHTLFTLPKGYRPSVQLAFCGMTYNNNLNYASCNITIKTNGDVVLNNGVAVQSTDALNPINAVLRFKL